MLLFRVSCVCAPFKFLIMSCLKKKVVLEDPRCHHHLALNVDLGSDLYYRMKVVIPMAGFLPTIISQLPLEDPYLFTVEVALEAANPSPLLLGKFC